MSPGKMKVQDKGRNMKTAMFLPFLCHNNGNRKEKYTKSMWNYSTFPNGTIQTSWDNTIDMFFLQRYNKNVRKEGGSHEKA